MGAWGWISVAAFVVCGVLGYFLGRGMRDPATHVEPKWWPPVVIGIAVGLLSLVPVGLARLVVYFLP